MGIEAEEGTVGEEVTGEESGGSSADAVAEARRLGWFPKEEWKGSPDDWVDADAYLERGRTVLPILQANNQKLHRQLNESAQRLQRTEGTVKALEAALAAIEERHAEGVKQEREQAVADIRQQIVEASENGDHAEVARLTDELISARQAANEPVKKIVTTTPPAENVTPPAIAQWYEQNPEFLEDTRTKNLATAIATTMREEGESSTGAVFLDKVKEEVQKILGTTSSGRHSKSESGRGGSSGRATGGSEGRKTFADLPKDAKDACARFEKRMVGAGKKYKTTAEWQSAYATTYFSNN